jgi:20S proteasome subunit beta 4
MDFVVGISGENFCLVAYDTENYKSILKMKKNLDKGVEIGKNKLLVVSGNPNEVSQFSDYIQKSIQFHSLRVGNNVSTHFAANTIRRHLANYLRKSPVKIHLTLIGYDKAIGPSIFTIDYTGNLHRSSYVVQGYTSYLLLSLLNTLITKSINLSEGISILIKCVVLVKNRFLANNQNFVIKMVDNEGCKLLGFI